MLISPTTVLAGTRIQPGDGETPPAQAETPELAVGGLRQRRAGIRKADPKKVLPTIKQTVFANELK